MPSNSNPVDVVAAVVRRDDNYLICQRPLNKHHGGLWEFPGGKVEPGESHAEALARELREELALGVASTGDILYSGQEPSSSFLIHFIPVEVDGNPVRHEHERAEWLTLSEIKNLPLAPVDREFVHYMDVDNGYPVPDRAGI